MSTVDRWDDVVSIGSPFPRIEKVSALEGFHVLVKWKGGRSVTIDLAPTIQSFKLYAPLRNDRLLFESVHVVNASVIAWGMDDAIDMHVSELERLASEAMTSVDFKAFLEAMSLTWDEAAAQLGISRRMVGYYATSSEIPRHIALACAYLKTQKLAKSTPAPATNAFTSKPSTSKPSRLMFAGSVEKRTMVQEATTPKGRSGRKMR